MADLNSAWIGRLKIATEQLFSDLMNADRDLSGLLDAFAAALDPAPDYLHRAVLATALIDVCQRIGRTLHDQVSGRPCGCDALSWSRVGVFVTWDEEDPRIAFRDWAATFITHFNREHPQSVGARAAELLRADPMRTWTMPHLARLVGTDPVRLRREFHARFGMKISDYLQLVRATRAVSLFRNATKVEAIAWEVGYRSKKDLYKALRRWVGASPTELRALSDEERLWLEGQLRLRCRRVLHD